MSKLTKKDKEFLSDFVVGVCANELIVQLTVQGQQVTPEAADTIVTLLQGANLSPLTDSLAAAIQEHGIDIKRLIKVEKYLKQEETQAAIADAQLMGSSISELVADVLVQLKAIISPEVPEEV